MRNSLIKPISVVLVLAVMISMLAVSSFASAYVNIKINDINNKVVNITASAEKDVAIILASYKCGKAVDVEIAYKTLSEGTFDYTIESFEKGACDVIKAYVWEKDITKCLPLCESLSKLQLSASGSVEVGSGAPGAGVQIQAGNGITADIPQDVVLNDNTNVLTLTVATKEESDSNITLGEADSLLALDVHIEGVSNDNTVPITVDLGNALPPYLNKDAITLYHVENGETVQMECVDEFTAHNQFKYNPATGGLVLYLATFSEITTIVDTTNTWEGRRDYSWYNLSDKEFVLYNVEQLAAFGDIVRGYVEDSTANNPKVEINDEKIDADSFAGKTIKLGADIEIHSEDPGETHRNRYFYPIGDYTHPFKGTFDGMGHVVSKLWQNGWDMGDDPNGGDYYDSHLGLFSYVNDATIQNLTIDRFTIIMELCDVGCVAAYAGGTSTFKNISVFNSDASSYNKRVAGIVGSNPNKDNGATLNFENITVDNSNKFHSLWGTWDCATAGILGKLEADSYANLVNCHASAQLDVYNDVCANYQYYWYRYCGMMIGTVSRTTTENGYTTTDLSNVKATGCTVNFGDWNDYYYCELVENTLASYTHDHQFSRLDRIESLDEIKSGENWIKTGNFVLIDASGNKTCYHIRKKDGKLVQHLHSDSGEEIVAGETVLKEDKQLVYIPFRQVFGGLGWGVKGKDLDNFGMNGIKDITEGLLESRIKFEAILDENSVVVNYKTFTVDEFFKGVLDETIVGESVMVSITSVFTEEVVGTYTPDSSDWTKGKISFKEDFAGPVKITIQDYQFCTPTTLYVNISDEIISDILKFNREMQNTNVGIINFDDFLNKVVDLTNNK